MTVHRGLVKLCTAAATDSDISDYVLIKWQNECRICKFIHSMSMKNL